MINVKDYFKLARDTIGRNKYEMICRYAQKQQFWMSADKTYSI